MPSNIFSDEYPEETGKKQDNATREMAFDANFRMTRYVKQTYTHLKLAAVPIFFFLNMRLDKKHSEPSRKHYHQIAFFSKNYNCFDLFCFWTYACLWPIFHNNKVVQL